MIRHSSTALDGNAKQLPVQDRLLALYGLTNADLVTGQQVHGKRVASVISRTPQIHPETDGLLSDRPGIALGVYSADCVPIFLWSRAKNIVGALHAGWRGTEQKILSQAFHLLNSQWAVPPNEVFIQCGPHIRQCCYQVGGEVAAKFDSGCVQKASEGLYLSLYRSLLLEAMSLGVPQDQISEDGRCTVCGPDFFSYRRAKSPERMLSFISIDEK